MGIRDKTDDNSTCGCVEDWRIRCDRRAASGKNQNDIVEVHVVPEATEPARIRWAREGHRTEEEE